MSARQIITSYLIFQSLGTALWWGVLLWVPTSVKWFQPAAWPSDSLLGFWLGDAVMLIVGSAFAAYAILSRRPWASIIVWALTAAVWYPTLYCIGVSLMTDQAWMASAIMVSMAGLTLAMATVHGHTGQTPATFRVTPMSKATAIGWTLAQVLIFWSTFLWILPKGIVELEQRLSVSGFTAGQQQVIAALILFAAASALGLASAIVMATQGNGTPLPTASAPKLVVTGPYRFVRNPMALAGILQGLAVGWSLGSYGVIVYCIAGALAWHLLVRPLEERELQERFGDSYSQYKQDVWLWIPRIKT